MSTFAALEEPMKQMVELVPVDITQVTDLVSGDVLSQGLDVFQKAKNLDFLGKVVKGTEIMVDDMVDDMDDMDTAGFVIDTVMAAGEESVNAAKLLGKKLVTETKDTIVDKKLAAKMQLDAVKSEVMQLYRDLTDNAFFKKAEAFELTKEALKDKHMKPVYTFDPAVLDREAFTGQTDINTILENFANSYTFAKTLSLSKDGHHHLPDGYTRSKIDKHVYYDENGVSNVVRVERGPMPVYDKHHRPHVQVTNVYNDLKKDPLAIYGSLYTEGSHKSNYGSHKVVEEVKETIDAVKEKIGEKKDVIKEKLEEKKDAIKEKIVEKKEKMEEKKAAVKEKVDAAHDKIKEKLDAIKDLVKKDHYVE